MFHSSAALKQVFNGYVPDFNLNEAETPLKSQEDIVNEYCDTFIQRHKVTVNDTVITMADVLREIELEANDVLVLLLDGLDRQATVLAIDLIESAVKPLIADAIAEKV